MSQVRLAASLVVAGLLLGPTALAPPAMGLPARTSTPAFQSKKDDELKKAILESVEKEKSHSFKSELTPEQVDGLVAHIPTFKK